MSDSESPLAEDSSYERKLREKEEKPGKKKGKLPKKEVKPKKELLNSDYKDEKNALEKAIFYSLFMYLSEIDDWQEGYVEGRLKEDIGPVKKGTEVQLVNRGEEVTINLKDQINEDEWDWYGKYAFKIILEKPTIIESKSKM